MRPRLATRCSALAPRYSLPVLCLLGLVLLATFPARAQQAPKDPTAGIPRIGIAELKKLVDRDAVVVVDVRDPQSYGLGHIPGAILVPLDGLEKEAAALRASGKPIVTYCA